MHSLIEVLTDVYRDSILLMRVSKEVESNDKINQVLAVMGTPANLSLIEETGFTLPPDLQVGPNDLLIVIQGKDDHVTKKAKEQFLDLIEPSADVITAGEIIPQSISDAIKIHPESNIAVISVPGDFAAYTAREALQNGLHVFLFSDGVSLEDEIKLKEYARKNNLLMMGPDCGTALISGVGLGFANKVPSGPVGIIAASGTGAQALSSSLADVGVSHVIGCGSRDLKKEVGAITALQGISALGMNPGTKVIVVVSKPADLDIVESLRRELERTGKPHVLCFLGLPIGNQSSTSKRIEVSNLDEAVSATQFLLGRGPRKHRVFSQEIKIIEQIIQQAVERIPAERKFVRGLFGGGTFCYEAIVVSQSILSNIYSNLDFRNIVSKLEDPWKSEGHCFVDLGEDTFTRGRPHPMIDRRITQARIKQEANNPETAVILLDFILGYGAHNDPVGAVINDIREAIKICPVVASISGTENDPQDRNRQMRLLEDEGVIVLPSNAQAALTASLIAVRKVPSGLGMDLERDL